MLKLYNKNIIRNTTVKMKVEESFNGVEFWIVNSVKKKKKKILPPVTASSEQYTYTYVQYHTLLKYQH